MGSASGPICNLAACLALPYPALLHFASPWDALPRPGVPALPCLPVYSSARFEHCSEPGGGGGGGFFFPFGV